MSDICTYCGSHIVSDMEIVAGTPFHAECYDQACEEWVGFPEADEVDEDERYNPADDEDAEKFTDQELREYEQYCSEAPEYGYADIDCGRWDDDPNVYDGTYSEE